MIALTVSFICGLCVGAEYAQDDGYNYIIIDILFLRLMFIYDSES